MKAIVYHDYGSPDVLRLEEIEKPTPGDGDVLVKVRAASLNPLDWHMMRGKPVLARVGSGLRKPKVTRRSGRDVAGQVEAVGRNVTQFKPGDAVFGVCNGSFAEFGCASESELEIKPDNVTFEQAASVPIAGFTALQGLRDKGRIQAGQNVLINGAGGGVGTFAVQIAKSFGAEVTGVCSTGKLEMVRSIGADHVLDYSREDFTKRGQRYELIFDCVTSHSVGEIRRVLTPNGIYVMVGGPNENRSMAGLVGQWIIAFVLSKFVSQRLGFCMAKLKRKDLAIMGDLMAAGKLTPVIDTRCGLSEVQEAMRYLGKGHTRGKIVISLA